MASVHSPDYIEPLKAFRTWLVEIPLTGSLRSVTRGHIHWMPGEALHADCMFFKGVQVPPYRHRAPRETCTCGIYGAKFPEDAITTTHFYLKRHATILGTVKMWGQIIEYEKGYRAEYAYPSSFLWVSSPGLSRVAAHYLLKQLGNDYIVPVHNMDPPTEEELTLHISTESEA